MVETIPWSIEQISSVRREAERILNHPAFQTSERCTRLLRYLVERTLNEPGEQLKERQVGHEAFGKPVDYDTATQPIVRNAATETRKRLRQIYSESPGSSGVRIELSPGGYLLTFSFHDAIAEHGDLHEANEFPHAHAAAVAPSPEVRRRELSTWAQAGAMAVLLTIAGCVGFVVARRPQSHTLPPESIASSPFWQPIFASTKEVFISVGHSPVPEQADATALPPGLQRFSMTDLRAYTNIAGVLEARGKTFQMRSDRSTTIEDLRDRPIILIGNFNNVWVSRLTSSLRYRYTSNAQSRVRGIEDRDHPGVNLWEMSDTLTQVSTVNYAIAERFKSPITGDVVVCVSSLGTVGTQVASEFLTRQEFLKSLPASLSDPSKSIQIVLRIPIVDGTGGTPEVLRSYVW